MRHGRAIGRAACKSFTQLRYLFKFESPRNLSAVEMGALRLFQHVAILSGGADEKSRATQLPETRPYPKSSRNLSPPADTAEAQPFWLPASFPPLPAKLPITSAMQAT